MRYTAVVLVITLVGLGAVAAQVEEVVPMLEIVMDEDYYEAYSEWWQPGQHEDFVRWVLEAPLETTSIWRARSDGNHFGWAKHQLNQLLQGMDPEAAAAFLVQKIRDGVPHENIEPVGAKVHMTFGEPSPSDENRALVYLLALGRFVKFEQDLVRNWAVTVAPLMQERVQVLESGKVQAEQELAQLPMSAQDELTQLTAIINAARRDLFESSVKERGLNARVAALREALAGPQHLAKQQRDERSKKLEPLLNRLMQQSSDGTLTHEEGAQLQREIAELDEAYRLKPPSAEDSARATHAATLLIEAEADLAEVNARLSALDEQFRAYEEKSAAVRELQRRIEVARQEQEQLNAAQAELLQAQAEPPQGIRYTTQMSRLSPFQTSRAFPGLFPFADKEWHSPRF